MYFYGTGGISIHTKFQRLNGGEGIMKKITMFIEDLSDDYDLVAFYPNTASQSKLREQFNEEKRASFEDGVKDVIEFIDKNPPPEAGAKLRIADIGDAYEAEYEAPRAVEMPVPPPPAVHKPKSSIDPEDITVTSEGCIINGRFMPADLLDRVADAVSSCQSDEY